MPSNYNREISLRDQEIARLQNHINSLSNQLESVMQKKQQQ